MHRSFSIQDVVQARLCKRIWWSIYVRERQCAAALGLPNRIRDEDYGVPSLTPLDLDDIENATSPALAHNREHVNYAIEMAKLARFLGNIVWEEYTPNSDCSLAGRTQLKAELNGWYHQLPDVLRLGGAAKDMGSNRLDTSTYLSSILTARWHDAYRQMAMKKMARRLCQRPRKHPQLLAFQ